ncbi:MAG: peroxiredoxin [Nitrososphaerales archaeon]
MVIEGEIAQDFELPSNAGELIRLSSFRNKSNVVLCFYPKNHMLGCPSKKTFEQAKSVFDNYQRIKGLHAEVLGISVDTVESHKKFVEEYGLPYRLLSDVDKKVCKEYAGLNMYGLAKRTTFIIDKQGRIEKILRGINPKTLGDEIVAVLSEIRTL